jgi:hypothetical protein
LAYRCRFVVAQGIEEAHGVSLIGQARKARMGHDSVRAAMIYQFSRELHQTGEGTADLRQLAA